MAAVVEGLALARSPDRLYPIHPSPWYDFYAGRTADGRQLLAGEWCPDVVVGLFDGIGNLRQTEYRTISLESEVEERLREWYGYTPGLVRVKQFCIPPGPIQPRFPPQWAEVGEPRFAIAPFPFDWEGCYGDPSDFPAADPDYVEMVRGWIERGNFALFWGNELHLDSDGQVVGS
jgi:hypothetical protein